MAKERILILDADSGAGLGVVQSLGASGYHCILGAAVDDCPAFGSRWAHDKVIYPDPLYHCDPFKAWISDWKNKESVDLIIPVTEATLVPLHEMRASEQLCQLVAMPSNVCLDAVLDKERLRVLAAGMGVNVPDSVCMDESGGDRVNATVEWLRKGPVVVKALRSKTWKGNKAYEFPAKIVNNEDELNQIILAQTPYTPLQVQKWVPGHGYGVEVLVSHGKIVMSFAHERLHEVPLAGGASSYRKSIPMPPELYAASQKVMSALEYHGVAMVEFRGGGGGGNNWLMEVNPRFWGSLPLSSFSGVDFPRALVEMTLRGITPGESSYRTGRYARNIERDIVWFKLVLMRFRHSCKCANAKLLGRSLLEVFRVFSGREIWDGACFRDPMPILRILASVVGREFAGMVLKVRNRVVRVAWKRLSRLRSRRFSKARRILFLCYGNVCRSAYAEKCAKALGDTMKEFRSAGFHNEAGRRAPEDFQRVALAHGVDISNHQSRCVSAADLEWADMICIMDEKNFNLLRGMSRNSLRKVIWLGALDGKGIDISDPYDMSQEGKGAILCRLDSCLGRLAEHGFNGD